MKKESKTILSRAAMTLFVAALTIFASPTKAWANWDGGTYTATADEEINGGVNVTTDATLTISSGKTVTVNGGIVIDEYKRLIVKGGGTLVVNGSNGSNGSNGGNAIDGNVIIYGANVQANGGNGGNGSDGSDGSDGNEVCGGTAPDGGDGGNGGNGGNGGSAFTGQVTIISGSIIANGGIGGNGGAGGNGGTGGYGNDLVGNEEELEGATVEPGDGGDGGDAGNGGDGGNGGYAFTGNLIFYGGTVDAYGGSGGEPGDAGTPGTGGGATGTPGSYGNDGSAGEQGTLATAFAQNVTFNAAPSTMTGDGYSISDNATGYQCVYIYAADADIPVLASGNCGTSVTWSLNLIGELTISGTGAMADYEDANYQPWADKRDKIKSIVIGNGVTSIGRYAFSNCEYVTSSVSIPASVESIGYYSFNYCSMPSIIFADGSALETIDSYAFYCCSFTSIALPNGVTSIGGHAFDCCSGLTSVTIPASVTNIGESAFESCMSLASVTFASGSTLTTISDNTFKSTGLTSITLPASVTSIGSSAFYYCTGLTSIAIPASVTSIGSSAFEYCTGMTSVTFADGSALTTIGDDAFNSTGLTSITLPSNVTSIGGDAFESLTSVTLNSNPVIGYNAFGSAAVTMNLTANSAGGARWATFYNENYNFQADENTQVFKVDIDNAQLLLHEVTDKIVNKETPVVLKTTGGGIPVMTLTTSSSSNNDYNSLYGVDELDGAETDGSFYVLNYTTTNGVGFYKLGTGNKVDVGKAYLKYTGTLSREFFGFNEEATAISEKVIVKSDKSAPVYDLQGRRVENPTKGLYIVDGKKVAIK